MKAAALIPVPAFSLDTDAAFSAVAAAAREMSRANPIEITPETRIDRFLKEVEGTDDAEGIDYLDLGFRIKSRIGVSLDNADWDFLSGWSLCKTHDEWESRYARLFTFGRLAELIACRAQICRVQPVTILGSTSLSAGAFRTIQRIAAVVDPKIESFAPSTPILDRLRGKKLELMCQRVRLAAPNRVPPLNARKAADSANDVSKNLINRSGAPLCILIAAILGFGFLWRGGMARNNFIEFLIVGTLFSLLVSGIIALVMGVVCGILPFVVNRVWPAGRTLPRDIETFGDLAQLVAGERGGWCTHCGYDLTGLSSQTCPECGESSRENSLPNVPRHANFSSTQATDSDGTAGRSKSSQEEQLPNRQAAMRVVEAALEAYCGRRVTVSRETRIDRLFDEIIGWDECDVDEFAEQIEQLCGYQLPEKDWDYLSGWHLCKSTDEWQARYAPMFTFGRLADLLAHRAKLATVEPVTVLGTKSLAAGAFRAIQSAAKQFDPQLADFAPSTPILDRIRLYDLPRFWGRMRALHSQRIPVLAYRGLYAVPAALNTAWIQLTISLGLFLGSYQLNATAGLDLGWHISGSLFLGFAVRQLLTQSMELICRLHARAIGNECLAAYVLPNGIRTFADLARLIAGDRAGWCPACNYDLTGLQSPRCPECGRTTQLEFQP